MNYHRIVMRIAIIPTNILLILKEAETLIIEFQIKVKILKNKEDEEMLIINQILVLKGYRLTIISKAQWIVNLPLNSNLCMKLLVIKQTKISLMILL
jgi:hypothetical protein